MRRRVAAKAWFPAGPRVFQVAEHDETPALRTWAAMLSLGPDAVLVGRSAAWWWGVLDVAPARVEVAVGRDHQPRPRGGVRLLRRDVEQVDRTRVRGLIVTTRAPTVLDAAVGLGLEEGARLMDRALLRKRVDPAALREVHERRRGRYGAVLAEQLLALADGGARSEAERRGHRLVRRAGLWAAGERGGPPARLRARHRRHALRRRAGRRGDRRLGVPPGPAGLPRRRAPPVRPGGRRLGRPAHPLVRAARGARGVFLGRLRRTLASRSPLR